MNQKIAVVKPDSNSVLVSLYESSHQVIDRFPANEHCKEYMRDRVGDMVPKWSNQVSTQVSDQVYNRSFFHRLVKNLSIDYYRRQAKISDNPIPERSMNAQGEETLGELLDRRIESAATTVEQDKLKMVKMESEGYTQVEIAEYFGLAQSTASRWITEGKEVFRNYYNSL